MSNEVIDSRLRICERVGDGEAIDFRLRIHARIFLTRVPSGRAKFWNDV